MIRRFGAIGDIHCEDRALEAALGYLRDQPLDRILAVGDIVDGPGDADRCCELLMRHDVLAVRGNHERWFLGGELRDLPDSTREVSPEARRFIESLPPTIELETPVGPMMLCHAVGDDDMAVLTPDARGYGLQSAIMHVRHRDDLALMVGGHTHQRMLRALGPFTFLNPGTLHRDHDPSFAVVDLDRRRVRFMSVHPDGDVSLAEEMALP